MTYFYRTIQDSEIFDKLKEFSQDKTDSSLIWNVLYGIFNLTPFITKDFFILINLVLENIDKNYTEIIEFKIQIYYSLLRVSANPDFTIDSRKIIDEISISQDCINNDEYPIATTFVGLFLFRYDEWIKEKLYKIIEEDKKYATYKDIVFYSLSNAMDQPLPNIRLQELLDKIFSVLMTKDMLKSNKEITDECIYTFFLKFEFQNKEEAFTALNETIFELISFLCTNPLSGKGCESFELLSEIMLGILSEANIENILKISSQILPPITSFDTEFDTFYQKEEVIKHILNILKTVKTNFIDTKKTNGEPLISKECLSDYLICLNTIAEAGSPEVLKFIWSLRD